MKIEVVETPLDGVKVVVPDVFRDERGFFLEVFRRDVFEQVGLPTEFVQLNHSRSVKDVVRGLHFQWEPPMGKLMRVTEGEAFLVAVDIRPDSPTLGGWFGTPISAESMRQVWAPAGFARGFCVLSDHAEIEYLCTGTYNSRGESGIRWDDPDVGIEWPVTTPILSKKDSDSQSLREWLSRPESRIFAGS